MQKSNSKFKSGFKKKIISNNLRETDKIAEEFIENLNQDDNIILLQGELGAGKTTFSQKALEHVGAEGPFTSPTFVIMKDYEAPFKNDKGTSFKKIYHLDCYRIDEESLDDIGWRDIISDKNNLVLVEWPERIEKALPEKYLKINFEVLDESRRKIEIS